MRILVSGASGLIGSALVRHFRADRHDVVRLVRGESQRTEDEVSWDPEADRLAPADLEGFEAVVHLAGENVANARWTARQKAKIRDSRIRGTRLLSAALAGISRPPRVLASASAVGYYGGRGDEPLSEQSPAGSGFLADVCRDWEAATEPAAEAGIRVVRFRLGMVLAGRGGALARMLPGFRWGLGGRLGDGRQYVSWITLPDVVGAVDHLLRRDTLEGPVNLVAPNPVTNARFTRSLGRLLHRPTILPVPEIALRTLFGQMADELLLASIRAVPRQLLDSGYRFHDPELDSALRHVLKT
ncbi:MAG: TIGR01777 family oxidoreductase [Pirellulales bacterium]|nr:TIGR01777 family oxidoreductase [Pirellulales bacterium]